MKKFLVLFIVAFAAAFTVTNVGGTPAIQGTLVSSDARLSVELALEPDKGHDGDPIIRAAVTIKNTGNDSLVVQDPNNRSATTFVVTNALGNFVAPTLRGKADPAFLETELKPGKELTRTFAKLEIITGTAWLGYDFKAGETYHILAVYRPNGMKGPGFCSKEQILTVK